MHYFFPFFLLFNLTLSTDVCAQKEMAVADFRILTDGLLSDLEAYTIIDTVRARNKLKLEGMIATFYRMMDTYSGCCCSPEQLARNLSKLKELRTSIESFAQWSGDIQHTLESRAVCAADSIVREMVDDYIDLEESPAVFPKEHALYVDPTVMDLTEWVLIYINKRLTDNLREDFYDLISIPKLDRPGE